MKLLIDMNLSPEWVRILKEAGFESQHWSSIGDGKASDSTILEFAQGKSLTILTLDLDFGTLLAISRSKYPSVVQLRREDVDPAYLATDLIQTLRQYESQLDEGALLVLEQKKIRIRMLPLLSATSSAQ